jgi:hypothetical protein
VQQIQQNQ